MRVPFQHVSVEQVPFLERAYTRARLGPDLDHALAHEDFHRLSQRISADAEFRGKVALGRKSTVFAEIAADDSATERTDDLVVQLGAEKRLRRIGGLRAGKS